NTVDILKTSAGISSPLPVTWLYVNAKEKNNVAVIEWATAQEINNDYFLVQRSTDGMHYSDIAKIKAYGNSNTSRNYAYTDGSVSGVIYYRIQQVDIDGKKSDSKVVKVTVAGHDKVQLLQNPVHDNLRLKCTEEQIGGRLIITDASGRVVNKTTITSNLLTINTSNLINGVYYLSVQDKNGRVLITQPFVKQ
ncbi:MAG TPA: T9SS type A sorting domain-containing protein, partial [Flavisolibacter sp.]|nr:T9SS type A sorting domain-containing protein [Flavisolibacter sp.]